MDVCLLLFRRKIKAIQPDVERQFLTASWEDSLKFMGEAGFLSKILRYATDTINAEMVDLVTPYLNHPYALIDISICSLF